MTLNKPSGWEDWIGTVQNMDCLEGMKQMPEGVVHCVVTSPPYYGLRDYGTAKWEGGEADCDHMPRDGRVAEKQQGEASGVRGGEHLKFTDSCPYCGARRVDPQLGLENTPELYVSKMVEVFREVKRIMHPTGCLWLNMGDSYCGYKGDHYGDTKGNLTARTPVAMGERIETGTPQTSGLKPKDLLEMPSRLVLALQADGWWLRCRIPWLKRNAMPESVQGSRWERHRIKIKSGDGKNMGDPSITGKRSYLPQSDGGYKVNVELAEWQDCPGCPKCDPNDGLVLRMSAGRPTQAVEYVFLLSKSHDYFYDGEAVRVKATKAPDKNFSAYKYAGDNPRFATKQGIIKARCKDYRLTGRSRRNSDWFFESWQGLWTDENGEPLAFIVNPKPYKRSHFATFPPGLVIPCIRAGTSERGCCPDCKSPWVRVVEKRNLPLRSAKDRFSNLQNKDRNDAGQLYQPTVTQTLGWRPTCSCGKEPVPCLGFDPFAGTGTVIEVARKMGRAGLGFEISEEYVKEYCAERLAQGVLDLKTEGK